MFAGCLSVRTTHIWLMQFKEKKPGGFHSYLAQGYYMRYRCAD